MNPRAASLCLCMLLVSLLTGCEKARQDMYDQPKYKPFARSDLFPDGASARPLPDGTVPSAAGPFAGTSSGRLGGGDVQRDSIAAAAQSDPNPVTMQWLRRGQQRYAIYCSPCHSPVGDGDGLVVRRGFPRPPSFHLERLRAAPDRHYFDVMTHGYGVMRPYAEQVEPADRWAIVEYIRALQLSQHAEADRLPADLRNRLDASAGARR